MTIFEIVMRGYKMECLNMVGGECISVLHMMLFIFALLAIGFLFGISINKKGNTKSSKK